MRSAVLLLTLTGWLLPAQEPPPEREYLQYFTSIHVPKGEVAAEAVCILCSIRVDGELTSEAVAVWGNVEVSGSVGVEVVAAGGSVTLLPGSRVGDEVVAVAGRVDRAPDAVVGGEITELPWLFFPGQLSLPWPGFLLFALAAASLLLLAALLFRRSRAAGMKSALQTHPGMVFLVGLGGLGVIFLLYQATGVLGPLEEWADWMLFACVLIPAWLGSAGLVRVLGDRIARDRPGWAALSGASVLALLMLVPLLGLLLFLLIFPIAWGTVVQSRLGSNPDWLSSKLAEAILTRIRRSSDTPR